MIDRLREAAAQAPNRDLLFEAADEIERLSNLARALIDGLPDDFQNTIPNKEPDRSAEKHPNPRDP